MGSPIVQILRPAAKSIGSFEVRRALPSAEHRSVGPFLFWDEMGPATFAAGDGLDVRPHPHIGLATVTHLFEGSILHRDSLGTARGLEPGAINWMAAGGGIVHSERTPDGVRSRSHRLHGIQAWVGLPKAVEEGDPSFAHHRTSELPEWRVGEATLRLVAGTAFGLRSPVETASDLFLVHAEIPSDTVIELPEEHPERAVYVVLGGLAIDDERVGGGSMAVLRPGTRVTLRALGSSRAMLLGGAPLDGERHLRWNLVASDRRLIDDAARDWTESIAAGFRGTRFRLPPDEHDAIPMPGAPTPGPPEPCGECPTT